MLLDIFVVLALSAFAGILIGGTLVVRRLLGVVTRKSKLESVKMDIQIDSLQHDRRLARHGQHVALLQLTDGKESKPKPAEEPAETVKVKLSQVQEPPTRRKGILHHFRKDVEDAEWGESPTAFPE